MTPDHLPSVLNHVWQSTIFAVLAGLLALAFRKSQAQTRYWIWLAASLKFLVPFSLLVTIGSHVEWRTARAVAWPEWPLAIQQVSRPLITPVVLTHNAAVEQPAAAFTIPDLVLLAWGCGLIAVLFFYWRRWGLIRLALEQAAPLDLQLPIRSMSSQALLEPAVFGIFRPILLLPEAITSRLTAGQLATVFAHELCHVRRRDNLTAALHMIVEAIFWFHPLVWWLGARLVAERERACDEAVVEAGNEPQLYAEAILEVCKLYLESPLACAAGVSGANLAARVERIMTARMEVGLGFAGKLLLTAAGILAIATPLVVGLVIAPARQLQASPEAQTLQSSAALSIKLSASPQPAPGFDSGPYASMNPRDFTVRNTSLKELIQFAYHIPRFRIAWRSWLGR